MLKGIDISNFQGNPDFNGLKSQVDFIICKSSEGTGYVDPTFIRTQAECRRLGILLGYYHFARPDLGNTPQAEAGFFLQTIGTIHDGEILTLDFEVGFANPVPWCLSFLNEVNTKTGNKPLIYLNQSQIQSLDWSPVVQADYGLWVASYDNNPQGLKFATPWAVAALKQYTSGGTINGISGHVDLDSFFGDANIFKAYGFKSKPTPPVQVVITDQTKLDIGDPFGTMEFQAVKSTLKDQKSQITSLTAQVSTISRQRDDYQSANNIQANQITHLNGDIASLTQQLKDAQATGITKADASFIQSFKNWIKSFFQSSQP